MEGEIEKTVMEILEKADMSEMTEFKVRKMAGEKLGLNLSGSNHKKFVRGIVESFLRSKNEEQDASQAQTKPSEPQKQVEEDGEDDGGDDDDEEEEEEESSKRGATNKEYDDDGDLIICRLSNRRRVTIQDFRGKTLVSIREYYEKDGKQLPSSKGISLTAEQWSAFSKAVPSIEEAITKMESRVG